MGSAKLQTAVTRSVLITRPQADSDATAARIAALGYRPIVAPFLAIAARSPALPRHPQAIVVTSGNALDALAPSAIPLLAVGDSTASRARSAGFSQVCSAGRDAAALAKLVSQNHHPDAGTLLLASGAKQGQTLAADLRARGFTVVRRVCYAAVPVRQFPPEAAAAILAGTLHAILFLSAETAAVFMRLLPPECRHALASVNAITIGTAAAARLEPLPWRRVWRASEPTLDAVLALI